jgi:hypothetical protein
MHMAFFLFMLKSPGWSNQEQDAEMDLQEKPVLGVWGDHERGRGHCDSCSIAERETDHVKAHVYTTVSFIFLPPLLLLSGICCPRLYSLQFLGSLSLQ